MKNVTIVGILIVSGLLTACHTKDSNTQTTTQVSAQAPVPASPSPIDAVRNGYLESKEPLHNAEL
jgi:major membrane immunogen (membrane-anchored lipoprotein)